MVCKGDFQWQNAMTKYCMKSKMEVEKPLSRAIRVMPQICKERCWGKRNGLMRKGKELVVSKYTIGNHTETAMGKVTGHRNDGNLGKRRHSHVNKKRNQNEQDDQDSGYALSHGECYNGKADTKALHHKANGTKVTTNWKASSAKHILWHCKTWMIQNMST